MNVDHGQEQGFWTPAFGLLGNLCNSVDYINVVFVDRGQELAGHSDQRRNLAFAFVVL